MKARILSALFLLTTSFALAAQQPATTPPKAPAPAGDAPEKSNNSLDAKKQELALVSEQINAIQDQAKDVEQVRATMSGYHAALKQEMLRDAPEMKDAIDRQEKLVSDLNSPKSDTASNETQGQDSEKLKEYLVLREKLAPVEQKANTVDAVKEARRAFYTALVAEMQKIDPRTDTLLARHRELTSEILRLQSSPDSAG